MDKKTFDFVTEVDDKIFDAFQNNKERVIIDLKEFDLTKAEMEYFNRDILDECRVNKDLYVYELGEYSYDIRNQKYRSSNGMYLPPVTKDGTWGCYHCRTGKIPDASYVVWLEKVMEPLHKETMKEVEAEIKRLKSTEEWKRANSIPKEVRDSMIDDFINENKVVGE